MYAKKHYIGGINRLISTFKHNGTVTANGPWNFPWQRSKSELIRTQLNALY